MNKLMELAVCVLSVLTVANGCSVPVGGYKEPTPADHVFYSTHVAVGEVTEIIRPDPLYGDTLGNYTYGAMVTVQCTYKGGPLPRRIQIGGAGYIPGMCSSFDLADGKEYVLSLAEKRDNGSLYEQTQTAVLKNKLIHYLNVCDLNMQYPEGIGVSLHPEVCPPASKLHPCQRHTDATVTVMTSLSTFLFCVFIVLL